MLFGDNWGSNQITLAVPLSLSVTMPSAKLPPAAPLAKPAALSLVGAARGVRNMDTGPSTARPATATVPGDAMEMVRSGERQQKVRAEADDVPAAIRTENEAESAVASLSPAPSASLAPAVDVRLASPPPTLPATTPLLATAASPSTAPPTDNALQLFLAGLGLTHLEPRLVEQDVDLEMLETTRSDELKDDLAGMGLSIGERRKIINGLEQRANAAKKTAELKAAEEEMTAAAVKQELDDERIKTLRADIKKLECVLKERGMPEEIVCPITQEIMIDPVVAADGHTYERNAIASWLEKNNTSPLNGDELPHTNLTPNRAVRSMVQRFVEDCRRLGMDPNSAL